LKKPNSNDLFIKKANDKNMFEEVVFITGVRNIIEEK
jgi:hypothetical protein